MMKKIQDIMMLSLRLQKYFDSYKDEDKRKTVVEKFEYVWGRHTASHFLFKYSSAEDLIYKLDDDNLKLFIDRF